MTFDPQALYDATRPFMDQLDKEAEELRVGSAGLPYGPYRIEADTIGAITATINQMTNLGFLLARIRREQER